MNIFFIATSFLYIPIMISVSKMSNLRSVKESQPQRYILWQTVAVIISKIIHIPVIATQWYYDGFLSDLWYMDRLDWITAPLIMQMSYLGCNKKNLEVLFDYFKRKFHVARSVEPSRIERTTVVGQDASRRV
ncbi:hypothetical protein CAEBREN_25457 [Caenorhabditis brenneri]|uniref:Serpentine receptor class gamma n=1 Tax=Caenorhabditis brenneri TaxID=135651 RepID=G0NIV7_CAEBE|nr:hypothetical protein CAEBREN_25457 [Caenorhabditis brenneri]